MAGADLAAVKRALEVRAVPGWRIVQVVYDRRTLCETCPYYVRNGIGRACQVLSGGEPEDACPGFLAEGRRTVGDLS